MNDPTEIVEGIRLLIDVILDLADKYKGRTEILNRLGTCYYHTVRAFSHYSRHTSENLEKFGMSNDQAKLSVCLLYTSPSPRDGLLSRMPSSA